MILVAVMVGVWSIFRVFGDFGLLGDFVFGLLVFGDFHLFGTTSLLQYSCDCPYPHLNPQPSPQPYRQHTSLAIQTALKSAAAAAASAKAKEHVCCQEMDMIKTGIFKD